MRSEACLAKRSCLARFGAHPAYPGAYFPSSALGGYFTPGCLGGYFPPGYLGAYFTSSWLGGFFTPGCLGGYFPPGFFGAYFPSSWLGGYLPPACSCLGGYFPPGCLGGTSNAMLLIVSFVRQAGIGTQAMFWQVLSHLRHALPNQINALVAKLHFP